jgi:hypothetical protein
MKAFLAVCVAAFAAGTVLSGCESDMPRTPGEPTAKLQRGLTGQGTLYQPEEQANDPIIREQPRVGY